MDTAVSTAGGTPAGIRRALYRLSGQGLVTAGRPGDLTLYPLNCERVLYPAAEALLDARQVLANP